MNSDMMAQGAWGTFSCVLTVTRKAEDILFHAQCKKRGEVVSLVGVHEMDGMQRPVILPALIVTGVACGIDDGMRLPHEHREMGEWETMKTT
jgi:hypothetical protein